jgi:hypothetical protein
VDQLTELLSWDDATRREWLAANQPDSESDRTNWWLSLVQPLESRVTGVEEQDPAVVVEWARLSVIVLEAALESGALDAHEVANRVAWLSFAVCKVADRSAVPPSLDPDVVARRSLGLIDLFREDVVRMAAEWRARPLDDIRRLRAVKNLLRPLESFVDQLRDGELRSEVEQWLAIRAQLP